MSATSRAIYSESVKFARKFAFLSETTAEKITEVKNWSFDEERGALKSASILFENQVSQVFF